MSPDEQPAVVAYDGSDEAQAAVREAARLLPGRRLVVVSCATRVITRFG